MRVRARVWHFCGATDLHLWTVQEDQCLRRMRLHPGTLTTHPVLFSGSRLFVNANMKFGELRAEILDAAGHIIAPFSLQECVPVTGDATTPGEVAARDRFEAPGEQASTVPLSTQFRPVVFILGQSGFERSQPRVRGRRRTWV